MWIVSMGGTTITSLIACPFNMHGTVEPSNFMSLCGIYKMTLSWDVQTPTLCDSEYGVRSL